jgi:hypothetical protein
MSRKYFRAFVILILYTVLINSPDLITHVHAESEADLVVYQSIVQWANQGEKVHFRIDITNDEENWIVNPRIFTDLIPEGFIYQRHVGWGTYDPVTDVWEAPLTYLLPNDFHRIDIEVIAENDGWVPYNTRYYIDSIARGNGGPAALTFRRYIPTIHKQTNEEVTFYIEIKNNGPDWAYAPVKIFIPFPEGLRYHSQMLDYGTYDPISGIWELPGNFGPNHELKGMITAVIESETFGRWIITFVTITSPTNDPYIYDNKEAWSVGLHQPNIVIDPGMLYYGEVELWTQSTFTVTISNDGNDDLDIIDLNIDDPSFSISNIYYEGTIPNLPVQISPNYYLYVDVDFTPTSIGSYFAYLEIITNDPTSINTIVALEGEGVEFETPGVALIDLLDFYDSAVVDGLLTSRALGNNDRDMFRKLMENAGKAIDDGRYEEACEMLESALGRIDGDPRPPDWIIGDPVAKQELHDMIEYIINEELSCS